MQNISWKYKKEFAENFIYMYFRNIMERKKFDFKALTLHE